MYDVHNDIKNETIVFHIGVGSFLLNYINFLQPFVTSAKPKHCSTRPFLLCHEKRSNRRYTTTVLLHLGQGKGGVDIALTPANLHSLLLMRYRRSKEFSSPTTIIAFVNHKSGAASGGFGAALKKKLDTLLGSTDEFPKVFDLVRDDGTSKAFEIYEPNESMRIIVCGGDGSVCWVLNEIDQRIGPYGPAVAVMPLGTGNDMARFLKWGSRFKIKKTEKFITRVSRAGVIRLDRWMAQFLPLVDYQMDLQVNPCESLCHADKTNINLNEANIKQLKAVSSLSARSGVSSTVFYNYFSVGVDAEVALDFHNERNANPKMFTNRFLNLMHYGRISLRKLLDKKYLFGSICCDIELQVDGTILPTEIIKNVDGLLFLNIKTYAAGMKPWRGKCRVCKNMSIPTVDYDSNKNSNNNLSAILESEKSESNVNMNSDRAGAMSLNASFESKRPSFKLQRCDDGYLEIIGFRHYELANMKMGIQGRRLAQGKTIRLTLKKSMALEFDGEPFLADPCIINVERKNQAHLLAKRSWSSPNQCSVFKCIST
ncbi:hypothetical protein ACOME3_009712 [Neoechinorhynchus agilis]